MRLWPFLNTGLVAILIAAILVQFTACGYLLYPERRNQPTGERIDPAVAILDGLGLLLFIIPGVVAFFVDFTTHTIYFPPGERTASFGGTDKEKMVAVRVATGQLNLETVESVVSERLGKAVHLESENVRIFPVEDFNQIPKEYLK